MALPRALVTPPGHPLASTDLAGQFGGQVLPARSAFLPPLTATSLGSRPHAAAQALPTVRGQGLSSSAHFWGAMELETQRGSQQAASPLICIKSPTKHGHQVPGRRRRGACCPRVSPQPCRGSCPRINEYFETKNVFWREICLQRGAMCSGCDVLPRVLRVPAEQPPPSSGWEPGIPQEQSEFLS